MARVVRTLGISGSLRKASFNTAALRAAAELMPEGMSLEVADIGDIPLYNEDVRQAGFPPAVQDLRDRIAAADALLFAAPEYNYSMSGVLKNVIDWASRPPDPPVIGKPAGIMGATGGSGGTMRAQYHLRQCFVYLNMFPVNKPEVLIAQAPSKFDAAGKLTDPATRDIIAQLMVALRDWALRLYPGAPD